MLKDPETLTIAQVDGTEPGRAALVLIDLENPADRSGFIWEVFVEGEHGDDPHAAATRMLAATQRDWPGHHCAIVVNERANYIRSSRLLKSVLGHPQTPEDYLESRKGEGLHA